MSDSKTAARAPASRARETARAARERGEDLAGEARETVDGIAATVRTRVEAEAHGAKTGLAAGIEATAERLASAADDMTADAPHAETVAAADGGLEGTADAVRDFDLGAMPARLSHFAHKKPAAFLGDAAILGIAVGRFLKAQAPEVRGHAHDLSLHHSPAPDTAPGGTGPA